MIDIIELLESIKFNGPDEHGRMWLHLKTSKGSVGSAIDIEFKIDKYMKRFEKRRNKILKELYAKIPANKR